ncbi:MAG: phenylacetate--CoA ligase family protein [Anaerolineae bacterium]|nr:phenylacetate--CoA ligase family protein [Anaerolineae bacterium]
MAYASKDRKEKLYSLLPIPVQNAIFSLYGWQRKNQRFGAFFHKKLAELQRSEWWDQDQIREYQNKQLKVILNEAYQNVPYYSKTWRELGIHPDDIQTVDDLPKLPVLSKETVRSQPEAFINTRFDKHKLPYGLTSGTTGTPLHVALTPEALQFQWAVWWRHRARFGIRLGDRQLTFGARLPVPVEQRTPPYWRENRAINQVYFSTAHVAPDTVHTVVDWLNQEAFDFFAGYPSAMYTLVQLMEREGLRLYRRPKYVVTGSDALLPAFEQAFRRTFGVPVTEQYGMVEAAGNLAKCELGTFHLDFEFSVMETLPIPSAQDTPYRRLIFTGLANPAMPFIRYDVGDYGHIEDGATCACGRHSTLVRAIDGRVEDYVRLADGRRIIGLNQAFEWAPGVGETQIIQRSLDTLEVSVMPSINFDSKRDLSILETEFRKRMGQDIKIRFNLVESIPRGPSGKFRAVISELPAETAAEQALQNAVQHGTLQS